MQWHCLDIEIFCLYKPQTHNASVVLNFEDRQPLQCRALFFLPSFFFFFIFTANEVVQHDVYIKIQRRENLSSDALYLRQLSVSSSEATEALLEERVDFCLLYGRGQVHGVQ